MCCVVFVISIFADHVKQKLIKYHDGLCFNLEQKETVFFTSHGMPQNEHYRLITIPITTSMTNLQGGNPFNRLSQGRTGQTPPASSCQPAFCNFEQEITIDVDALAKNTLYACHKCNGALVPEEKCYVCHRISMRKCVNCGNEIPVSIHQSCENLILYSNLIKRKHQSSEKAAKN